MDESDETFRRVNFPKNITSNRYLFNGNVFYDHNESWIFGLEVNYRSNFKNENEVVVLPNLKYNITKHSSFHFGLGWNRELESSRIKPIAVMRAIVEF